MSQGFIACDGGWGTHDELYEMLTLVQTGKTPMMPIIVLSENFGLLKAQIEQMATMKHISKQDLLLIDYVKKPTEAINIVNHFYKNIDRIVYPRGGKAIKLFIKKPLTSRAKGMVKQIAEDKNSPYDSISFGTKVIRLCGKPHKSFGFLRMVVNAINQ